MSVYISFYKALPININNKKQVDVIRWQLIDQLLKRISNPIAITQRSIKDASYVEEMEAYRISSIPAKKKQIKWLRKASCKQVISKAHEVYMWQFANTLYTELDNLYFPIDKYISEDKYKYVITFKDAHSCLEFITGFGNIVEAEDKLYITAFFDYYDRKGLIQIY